MVAVKTQEISNLKLLISCCMVIGGAFIGVALLIGFLYWLQSHPIIENLVFDAWWGFWGWIYVTDRDRKFIRGKEVDNG